MAVLAERAARGRRHRRCARASTSASCTARAGGRRSGGDAAGLRAAVRRGLPARCTARTRPRTRSLALAAVEAARRRRAAVRRAGPRGLRRGDLARAGSRWSGAARRSCSTPRTTRTVPRPLVEALRDSFTFDPLVGVVGVMADKDVEGLLGRARAGAVRDRLHAELHRPRRCRPRSSARSRATCSASTASAWSPRLDDAHRAGGDARRDRRRRCGESIGSGGVLVTGSVVTVGEAARCCSRGGGRGRDGPDPAAPCAPAMLGLQAVVLCLTTPVMLERHRGRAPPSRWSSASG